MKNYTKQSILFFLALALSCAAGCKKDKKVESFTCTTCKNTPDAKAENNASSKGVYKGVVVGSTGSITVDILNSGTTVKATLVLDGATISLTSSSQLVAGQAYVADFTGTSNGQTYGFKFSVSATGGTPTASNYVIPGHPTVAFQLIKEASDDLIKAYEGTTAGQKDNGNKQSSVLNIVVSTKTNTWLGLSKDDATSGISISTGTISGGTLTCNCGPTTTVTGTFTEDLISGTYKGADNHGTFTAKRTL